MKELKKEGQLKIYFEWIFVKMQTAFKMTGRSYLEKSRATHDLLAEFICFKVK